MTINYQYQPFPKAKECLDTRNQCPLGENIPQ